jgi:hypothetical protein
VGKRRSHKVASWVKPAVRPEPLAPDPAPAAPFGEILTAEELLAARNDGWRQARESGLTYRQIAEAANTTESVIYRALTGSNPAPRKPAPRKPKPKPKPAPRAAAPAPPRRAIATPAGRGTLSDRTRLTDDRRRTINPRVLRYAAVYWTPTAITRHTVPDTVAAWSRHKTLADAEAAVQKHLDRGAVRSFTVDLQSKPERPGRIIRALTDVQILSDQKKAEQGSEEWREAEHREAMARKAHERNGTPTRSGRKTL